MNEEKDLIKKFLKEVEEKLPFWLKNNEDELKEVLEELEEHILDKVKSFEEKGEFKEDAINKAIFQMGKPDKIANEYKRRGTPKFYITEELWLMYLMVLKYAGIAVGLIASVVFSVKSIVIGLSGGKWLETIFQGLSSFFIWSVLVAACVSVLFVWLSYEGYFPEDIKNIFKSKEKLKREAQQPPKTKIIHPIIEEPKIEYPKGLDRPHSLIIGGIFTLVFGIIVVWQPITDLNVLIDPQFLSLLMMIGIFWIIIGALQIIHGIFVSWSYMANRTFYPMRAIISLASISILVLFLINPQIFPIFWWTESEGFIVLEIANEFYWIYYLVLSIIIIAIIGNATYNIYKAIKLDEDYFFEVEQRKIDVKWDKMEENL